MRSIYRLLTIVVLTLFATTKVGFAQEPPRAEASKESQPTVDGKAAPVTAPATAGTIAVVAVPTKTEKELAVDWILGFMTKNAPPGRRTFYVEAQETKEEALQRYNGIANAIVDVVFDPATKPLFAGASGRSRTVTVILAVMLFESGFGRNVDFGKGTFARGDSGKSWCLMQINVGEGKTPSWNTKLDRFPQVGDDPKDIKAGYTGLELVQDRKKCVDVGLRGLRISFSSCRSMALPLDQKLRVYGSGNCNGAQAGSRLRMEAAIKFWRATGHDRSFQDSNLTAMVQQEQQLAAQQAAQQQLAAESQLPLPPVQMILPPMVPAVPSEPTVEPEPVQVAPADTLDQPIAHN